MNTQSFAGYTTRVVTDPRYYGSECSAEYAEQVVERLSAIIKEQFPGIAVEKWQDGPRTTGPDEETIREIEEWISKNWTAAL